MSSVWRKKTEQKLDKNNRINIVIAIVFLLAGLTLYRMFALQILQSDYYTALASGQHDMLNEIKPNRGVIYINDIRQESLLLGSDADSQLKVGLYPYAYNKDFAHIFAIPKDLDDAARLADIVFDFFDKASIEKEIDGRIDKEVKEKLKLDVEFIRSLDPSIQGEKLEEAMARYNGLTNNLEYQESLRKQKDIEIEAKKKEKVSEYIEKFSKNDDPYEPIADKVDEDRLLDFYAKVHGGYSMDNLELRQGVVYLRGSSDQLIVKGIAHRMMPFRYYPEANLGSHLLGFVSYAENDPHGNYGLEGFFDKDLFGEYGSVSMERGGRSDIVILNKRELKASVDGRDLVLTIDRSIQYHACSELDIAARRHGADSGSVIVIDPKTGGILAMCSYPDYDPNEYNKVKDIKVYNNPAVFDQYEPGSVMKPLTVASGIDQGKLNYDTFYNDTGQIMIEGWGKPISNSDFRTHGAHGWVDMSTVLEQSLNTGAIFAMRQIGAPKFAEYLRSFGFGEKTGIELGQESSGDIRNLSAKKIKEIDAAVASFGQGVTATPLQMVMAYAALANNGTLMKPYLVREFINPDGTKETVQPRIVRKVVSEKAADTVVAMLVRVVENGHSKGAAVPGYYIGGKTGTAQIAAKNQRGYIKGSYIHTYIGMAPADEPRFVILTKLDDPKDALYAESTAVPLAGKISQFILQHYDVPKER